VEFIDRIATTEALIGLAFQEITAADAQIFQELFKAGDEIEVTTTAAT
jgi:hypothetical protein